MEKPKFWRTDRSKFVDFIAKGYIMDKKNIKAVIKMAKVVSLLNLALCLFMFFVFNITYMNTNHFFSYDLLSFNNILIFLYMFLHSIGFIFFAIPLYCVVERRYRDSYICQIIYYCIMICVIIAVLLIFCTKIHNVFLFFILMCVLYYMLIKASVLYVKNKFNGFFAVLAIALVMIICVSFANSDVLNIGFKKFLTDKSLAADKVEIYLKDKNRFVEGKMVFMDSKFAYVIYEDTKINSDGTFSKELYIANKRVPIENVTILNPLPKDSQ